MIRMSIIRNRIMKGCCQLFFSKTFLGLAFMGENYCDGLLLYWQWLPLLMKIVL